MTFAALRDMLTFVRDHKNIKEVEDGEVDPYWYALDTLKAYPAFWPRLMTSEFELNELEGEYWALQPDYNEVEILGGNLDVDLIDCENWYEEYLYWN